MAKIMIVDDSAYARRTHRAILEKAGHSVVEASTGTGAIELFSLEQPSVVVLDLSMEDIGGIDVLRTIRALDGDACVVVVSADIQRSTEQAVMASGAERFLAKPVNSAELVDTVAELVAETKS